MILPGRFTGESSRTADSDFLGNPSRLEGTDGTSASPAVVVMSYTWSPRTTPTRLSSKRQIFIGSLLEAVKSRRIIHQDLLLQRGVGRHQREELEQRGVVGHPFDIGLRPVGSPQYALGRRGAQRLRVRHGVGERRAFGGDALGAANLHPAFGVSHRL